MKQNSQLIRNLNGLNCVDKRFILRVSTKLNKVAKNKFWTLSIKRQNVKYILIKYADETIQLYQYTIKKEETHPLVIINDRWNTGKTFSGSSGTLKVEK